MVDEHRETLFFGHNKAAAQKNLQQLLQHAQDLHKIKSDKILLWKGWPSGSPNSCYGAIVIDGHWEDGESVFYRDAALEKLLMLQ